MAGLPEGMVGGGRGAITQIPAGMEAGWSQLSEEEQRQIAAVMSRAQELQRGSDTDRPSPRNPNFDNNQSPRHPSKPPDRLPKSRTVDAFKTEVKAPGRSTSTMNLRDPGPKKESKEEQKPSIMSSFLTDNNPLNVMSFMVNKFNPFDPKSGDNRVGTNEKPKGEYDKTRDSKGNVFSSQQQQSPKTAQHKVHSASTAVQQQSSMPIQQKPETKLISAQHSPSKKMEQPDATKQSTHPNISKPHMPHPSDTNRPGAKQPGDSTSFQVPEAIQVQERPAKHITHKQHAQQTHPSQQPVFTPQQHSEKQVTIHQSTAKTNLQQAVTPPMTTKNPQQQTSPMKQPLKQIGPVKQQTPGTQVFKQQTSVVPPPLATMVGEKLEPAMPIERKGPNQNAGKSVSKLLPLTAQQLDKMADTKTEHKTQNAKAPNVHAKKNICSLCNTTELLLDAKENANYNTCTKCQTTVCSLCGFNPTPHITEVKEWLCLNCQMQRTVGMDINSDPSRTPQPVKQKPISISAQVKPVSRQASLQKQEVTPMSAQPIRLQDKPSIGKDTSISISKKAEPLVSDKKIGQEETKEPHHSISSLNEKSDSSLTKASLSMQQKVDLVSPFEKIYPVEEKAKETDNLVLSHSILEENHLTTSCSEAKPTQISETFCSKESPKTSPSKVNPRTNGKPAQKELVSQSSPKQSPAHKPAVSQLPVQTASKPQKSQYQQRRFSLNLGSDKETPTPQPTTPQETVKGKLFGFGASIFSQASSLISTATQPGVPSHSTQAAASKQPPSRQTTDIAKTGQQTSHAPQSPKAPAIKKETKPLVAESASLLISKDQKPIPEKTAEAHINVLPKKEQALKKIEKMSEAAVLCPICQAELNIDPKGPLNFTTCTECKKIVCNSCGFNPIPHLTEVQEWLCLNCQTQRAITGQVRDKSKGPPLEAPKLSPKHDLTTGKTQATKSKVLPFTLNEILNDQKIRKDVIDVSDIKKSQTSLEDSKQELEKPFPLNITDEIKKLKSGFIADPSTKESNQVVAVSPTKGLQQESVESPENLSRKLDLMIHPSSAPLNENEKNKYEEKIEDRSIDQENVKENAEKDDKSDTSMSQQQKSPQGLSDTGYSSDGISSSLGEMPSQITRDEKELQKELKKESFMNENSPTSPSDLAKLESTVLSILEAQTSGFTDGNLRKSSDLYCLFSGQPLDRAKSKNFPMTPESYSSEEEELEDIQDEDDEIMEGNGKQGLYSRNGHKDNNSHKELTTRRRHDSLDDSSESENSPVLQRKRRSSNESSSSEDFKHEDSQGSGDDEDIIRKQIIEMSAGEDASGSEDEEFIKTKLKEISVKESQNKDVKGKSTNSKCKRLTKKSSASYDDDGIRRHSWHDDEEEDEEAETYDKSPETKYRETKSQESEELAISGGGGLRRFKTIELNSTISNNYSAESSKPSTKLYYDEEPELEMESLTDSPEDRSREDRSSSLHASSFTPGTSPTSVSSLDEDSDSSPSHKKMSGESKQQRKARHRSHGPVLPTIEDSSEEEELREEEELLKEQEKQRELEQQQRKCSSKKSKKDKDELRAQRRRERPKTPPSNLSPIEDASPTEELRQAAEMEELHRSSCSEYSPSIESEPEGFEISPEKILEVQKVYKLPTSVSLFSPTDLTTFNIPEDKKSHQSLKGTEAAYEEICKAKLYRQEKDDVFEKEPLYGGMLIEDYIYESLIEESYNELDSNTLSGQKNVFEPRVSDLRTLSMEDTCTDPPPKFTNFDNECFTAESFHSILPQEDIVSSSYIVPESHEIVILDNTEEKNKDESSGYYEHINSESLHLTLGTSPTQTRSEFGLKSLPMRSADVVTKETKSSFASFERCSLSSNSMSIPDVKITQHFTAEGIDDDITCIFEKKIVDSVVFVSNKNLVKDKSRSDSLEQATSFIVCQDTINTSKNIKETNMEHVVVLVPDSIHAAEQGNLQGSQDETKVCKSKAMDIFADSQRNNSKENGHHSSDSHGYSLNNYAIVPSTIYCSASSKQSVICTTVSDPSISSSIVTSVISSIPIVTSKVKPIFESTSVDSPAPFTAPAPAPPPPPLPPPTPPKPAIYSNKRVASKIPPATKTSAIESSAELFQEFPFSKNNKTHAPPPPIPPKPTSIPPRLVFIHKPMDATSIPKTTKKQVSEHPISMHKTPHAQVHQKSIAQSIASSMTLNLSTSAEFKLSSPTSPLSPHSNKSSPRLTKPSLETYVVITLPSEPGTPTDCVTTQTTCWPLQTPQNEDIIQMLETHSPVLEKYQQSFTKTTDTSKSIFSLPISTKSDVFASSIPIAFPLERKAVDGFQIKETAEVIETKDIVDLCTLSKVDYECEDLGKDVCLDLSAIINDSSIRQISVVKPAIVNLTTASPKMSLGSVITESATIVTCSTSLSYTTSLESLVDIGKSMTAPLKLTTTKECEGLSSPFSIEEFPLNLSQGLPAHSVTSPITKPISFSPGIITNGFNDKSTSQESVDSGIVDLSTTKSHKTIVTMDETTSEMITEIVEDDMPVDLTAGRRAICCDVVYKLPFATSCISQQPSTSLPEDRFGYRDDHYQYDRLGHSGIRGGRGMKPSMSDTNLAEAGVFLYKSKNTFNYPIGLSEGAVDLTSGKITSGEAKDYQTKTTGPYPETRQGISGIGISAPQYSQARITQYGMGSVLRSSNGVVYSSVATPIPSTSAITTQPGSIFSTTVRDLSSFITSDTVTSSQTQPLPRSYNILATTASDGSEATAFLETSLQTFPEDLAVTTDSDLVSLLTNDSESYSEITEDDSTFVSSEDGKQQNLDLQRELLELEKLKQQRLAEELEWERQEIQRFREQETFIVQKKLEELQSMKQHLLFQQEEERQAQFMMQQETLAQQQLHLEQIQHLQQQLHQQLEEQKLRQVNPYSYDTTEMSPQANSDEGVVEGQFSTSEEGHFWSSEHSQATVSVVEYAQNEPWYTVQSDGITQYISKPGVSGNSVKDININEENQLMQRIPCGVYEDLNVNELGEPRSYKSIVDSGVQTDDEDGAGKDYTGRKKRSRKGVDTSVQTDDEDQEEWEIETRSRRRSRTGKGTGNSDTDKVRQFSKVSSIAVQTVAEISVQTEPLGTIKTPSLRAKVDAKVEIIKHISAPEKNYKGESLGCQTETDSDVQSPHYQSDVNLKDKKRPTPLEIGYSSHLHADSSLQVVPSPPKSPKVLYSPVSPVSPSKVLESAFVPYEKTLVDISHKQHIDVVQVPPPSPKAKVMQRSLSDPKPLSPTAEDIAREQFQYSDGYMNKGIQSGSQKKVKRTLPNPPPEEGTNGMPSSYSSVGSVSRRRICRTTTMARAKILQDIDRELDLVERESSKLRKKQAELDEEEKEIDAKLRYLEMGINRRKEALLKEREKRERAYLQGVAEERDYMSDSEVSSRPTRIESHLGLERPQTTPQAEFNQYLPPQTQSEKQFAPPTIPYTQLQYQTPTLLTQAPSQYTAQTLYQPSLFSQQPSSYQTQQSFKAVSTMSFTPQIQSTSSQQTYQHPSQMLLIQQKARQGALEHDSKMTTHYDVIRNQPLIIAPVSSETRYPVSHLGSKYSTLDLRLGLDEKSSIASSPMSSISADSFYADLEHHASRNYVLIDDIGELTKGSGSLSSAFPLHEKELSKADRLLHTLESRRAEITDFLTPISTSTQLHTYGNTDEDSMEDPYELKLLKHQIKQEFHRGTESLDPLTSFSPYYHSDSLYRHFPKTEKYSISRLTLEKQAAKQLPPAILYQKQSKHKKALIDPKISKFSPIQESRDLEPDYSNYLSSSTSSIPSISSKVRLLQDDITYGLRKNITDQQKYLSPTLSQSLGGNLSPNIRGSLQDEVDKPYVSGSRSRPSSRPSSVYGLDLSIKRDLSSSSLRLKASETEALEGSFTHVTPSGRTKPSSLPISQSRGRIPIVAQNSEEESPLSPVGQPMGMARAAAGPLPPISADTRDQFGSSHSLPEVQQHMREESRTRGYDRDIAFIMDDFQHAMSDSEAYHLRHEETDWFDKPRESRLENGHGIDRRLPDKLSHSRSSHQEQMNAKAIQYVFPHARFKMQRDSKDHTVSGNGFGIRVVGGKEVPGNSGETGAYIAKILPGGDAEHTGKLTEGMQVLEWNGYPLMGKTYEEVQSIISQSSGEAEICVRLDINMLSNSQTPHNLELHDPGKALEKTRSPGVDPKQLAAELQKVSQQQTPPVVSSAVEKGSYIHSGTTSAASSSVPSPGQPGSPSVSKKRHSSKSTEAIRPHSHPISGELQLQVNYDKHLGNLIIHILQARNLAPRDNNGYSDPFVKLYLLPGRGAEYKRRTKYVQKSLNPEWNQTVIYKNISMEQLKKKTLEVTVWDYDRFSSNDFLGEVLIDLSNASNLDNMPHWYPLKEQSESIDHAKPHTGHSSQVPKPLVIKSRSHGIFPDPSKDMQIPTIEKSHSSPGSSKSSSEGHLRSHGPSRSQSKTSVTQTHLEDAGAAIAAAEAAVQQLRPQPSKRRK
ncbi:hypothetical protein GDO86_005959 [Hymenochirus boettgeri]|uniref:Piccolo presynaptic cytomatrix protein n=1 Tax=Hymenochirus boettgeri TaxID=247094 RepID=A0A8T2J947_9PIPI|nr:hypothetical protein GDO86_005959 [Hymenochirus boettgeri]